MIIAFSTANLYRMPFEAALEIIKSAGYKYIELDGAWSGGDGWETARHIKFMKPSEVLASVQRSGLEIASFHDMGGAIDSPFPTAVSAGTEEYLRLGDIPCAVFHTPHKKNAPPLWWEHFSVQNARDIKNLCGKRIVTIENMVTMRGYTVPLLSPEDMRDYCAMNNIGATLDTSHFASVGVCVTDAAKTLRNVAKTVHLSDYSGTGSHLVPGDGNINMKDFFSSLDIKSLYCVSIESEMPEDEDKALNSAIRARIYAEKLISGMSN